jgi:glucan phosphoethanolaminetransferase (alkaline phosphatase superfamily)
MVPAARGIRVGERIARPTVVETFDTVPWLVDWAAATALISVLATLMDVALMQRKFSYFTGGFLSADHVTHGGQVVAFILASFLADAAVTGVLVALTLWACGRVRIVRRLAVPSALAVAIAPLLVSNFIAYQLLAYLGDAFDFRLMFDLAGRDPNEILAVSSAHLTWIAYAALASAAVCVAAVVTIRRLGRSVFSRVELVSFRRAMLPALILLCVGLIATSVFRASSVVVNAGVIRKPSGRALNAIVEPLSDFDHDGAGLFSRPGDPALFDAAVRPYAPEIPGNGIDENGVGGDLPAGIGPYTEPPVPSGPWSSQPDIVFFMLESIRGDVIGSSFGGQPVTPVLNGLAARGISATHAYSHNGFTVQSRRHTFTGSTADVRGDRTLIDEFNEHGYETAYFSAQDESFGGPSEGIGFERAAVAYDARQDVNLRFSQFTTPGSLAVPYQVVVDRESTFLSARRTKAPLFLHVNFQDTHFPYSHRAVRPLLSDVTLGQFEIVPQRAEALRAMYLNTTRNVDEAIGAVLSRVRAATGRDAAVIVLSDHGESLFDEGFLGHGFALNEAQTRIPLIVTDLPVVIDEPFVQADLRDVLLRALTNAAQGAGPRLQQKDSKRIFQYLGSVQQPAQIALTGLKDQIAYDFRTNQVQWNGAEWRQPERLTPRESGAWLELIHLWERMILARGERAPSP